MIDTQTQIDDLKARPPFNCPFHGQIWPRQHGEKLCIKRQEANGQVQIRGVMGPVTVTYMECDDCEVGDRIKRQRTGWRRIFRSKR